MGLLWSWQYIHMFMIFPGIPFGFDFVSVWIEHSYGTGETFAYRLTLDSINLLTVIFKLDILLHHTNICSFRESSYLLPSAVRKHWLRMCLKNSNLFSPNFVIRWRGVTWEHSPHRERRGNPAWIFAKTVLNRVNQRTIKTRQFDEKL